MKIVTRTTHSENWLENIIDYLIDDEIRVVNYWCSGKTDPLNSIKINEDEVSINYNSGSPKVIGKVIACGKNGYSNPPLTPNNSGEHITIEEIYNISIKNGFLKFTNKTPELSTYIDIKKSHSSHTINGLDKYDNIDGFVKEINRSLRPGNDYTRSSDFAYLIFEPYIISYAKETDEKRIKKIKDFNDRNEKKRNPEVEINENGRIIINQI